MELKLVCNCGQKYKFDVEPVNRQMPFTVNCPVCGFDGTPFANTLLAQSASVASAPPPIVAVAAPPLPPPVPVVPPSQRPMPAPRSAPGTMSATAPAIPKYLQTNPATANNSFPLGILGAFLGAIGGVLVVVGLIMLIHLHIAILCALIGPMTGFAARLMYRGTSSSLGGVCELLACFTIVTTLYFFFPLFSIVISGFTTIVIGTGLAFKIASD